MTIHRKPGADPAPSERSPHIPPQTRNVSESNTKGDRSIARVEIALFLVGFLVYAATRFVGLTRYPIFFFCDEALQANIASDLVRGGLRDQDGTFLPPYFLNDKRWDLSLSVYLHALPITLFGRSVSVTRGTEVVVNLLLPLALALALKEVFRIRFWWIAPLVVAVIPTWFLHSRTAFQPAMTASFFGCFLAAYLLYRYRSPRWIYGALLCGAATFYSYTAGQGLMLITGLLLLVCDWRYHFSRSRRLMAGALALALLLAMPYVRYRILHPNVVRDQLREIDSYWIHPAPFSKKLVTFGKNYVSGFKPAYWFSADRFDLERHRMKGSGHLPVVLVPLMLVGVAVCVWRWRSPAHRAALIAPVGVPFSAAVAAIGIMRVLSMVVPFTLFVCLGMEAAFSRVRRRVSYVLVSVSCAAALAGWSVFMLRAALIEGPTWYRDYGLYGMQYGAPQLFGAIREDLKRSPASTFLVSPNWSNNPTAFLDYFLTDPERGRVQLGDIQPWMLSRKPLDPQALFILPAPEYELAVKSGKFVIQPPQRVLFYPDGSAGFYFVRLSYADNIDEILAADRERRRSLVEEMVTVQGRPARVRHSQLDMGRLVDAFDGIAAGPIRGAEANPFVLEFEFAEPRDVRGVVLDLGWMEFRLRAEIRSAGGGRPRVFTGEFRGLPPGYPHIDFSFRGGPYRVERIRLELSDIHSGETAHVHVYEVAFR